MNKIDTSTEAVTKLLDGVTPGPWAYNVHREVGPLHTEDDLAYGMICDVVCEVNFDADHMGNARFIAAARDLVPALLAERDALRRENENLRQIERNVQAVREHEYMRAEAALAEVERLKAQPEPIREITDADMANIVAHLSYECEPKGPLPNANSLMMEVVRLRNAIAEGKA